MVGVSFERQPSKYLGITEHWAIKAFRNFLNLASLPTKVAHLNFLKFAKRI